MDSASSRATRAWRKISDGDQLRVVGKDAAGIDHAGMLAGPLDLPIDPVPGDARFIAHDRPARAGETVEECGLAHIGTADDGKNAAT